MKASTGKTETLLATAALVGALVYLYTTRTKPPALGGNVYASAKDEKYFAGQDALFLKDTAPTAPTAPTVGALKPKGNTYTIQPYPAPGADRWKLYTGQDGSTLQVK